MKISTVREFRDNASGLLRSKDPILVTRRGRLAGVFFPWPEGTMPIELKREVFSMLSDQIAKELKKKGLTEDEIAADFETWRRNKRETRRRRQCSTFGSDRRAGKSGVGAPTSDRNSYN